MVMTSPDIDIITATIPRFREISGISRSRIYELLDAGELESVHVGARRLILIDSYRRMLARLRAAQEPSAAFTGSARGGRIAKSL
jgi:hypothetical protein